LRDGDALIIVPPFASIDRPSLAAHLLQACAGAAGFRVRVLYANLAFAGEIGVDAYTAVSYAPTFAMIGERLFARSAHGEPPRTIPDPSFGLNEGDLTRLEERAVAFSDTMALAVAALPFKVVGATTTFEQTNASLALLTRVKRVRPDIITILGGANCEGEMAEGVASIAASVDHIFSGECEVAFPAFLERRRAGVPTGERIIKGSLCTDLDALPTPDFTEYFQQRALLLPSHGAELPKATLPYESSRGCWWGQKHHCTFCGLNGEGMVFREKSPDRVIEELRSLSRAYDAVGFSMTDNIMPHTYWKTLLPRLAADPLPIPLFYEQKANLSLDQVLALKRAGVTSIQPGIEALSTALLKRMDKGVFARQNVMLLRYARSSELDVQWNLLVAFPGDEQEAYEETLALLPKLHHLQPPLGLLGLSIDRFSPYFQRPLAYGIRDLRPHPNYHAVFPAHADIERLAYRFVGDYASGAYRCNDVIRALQQEVDTWRARWVKGPVPALRIDPLGDAYLLRDTRGLPGTEEALLLGRDDAAALLRAAPYAPSPAMDRAIERRLGVLLDGYYVPLATASPGLLMEIEREGHRVTAPRGERRGCLPLAPRSG
jgi:ribosomal peptide maturation radical SAM protein 1